MGNSKDQRIELPDHVREALSAMNPEVLEDYDRLVAEVNSFMTTVSSEVSSGQRKAQAAIGKLTGFVAKQFVQQTHTPEGYPQSSSLSKAARTILADRKTVTDQVQELVIPKPKRKVRKRKR